MSENRKVYEAAIAALPASRMYQGDHLNLYFSDDGGRTWQRDISSDAARFRKLATDEAKAWLLQDMGLT